MSWEPLLIKDFKKVPQERVSSTDGDCMAACVASLLGLERASEVPPFHGPEGKGFIWLSEQGLWFEYSHPRLSKAAGDEIDLEPEPFPGYAIASVPSALFPKSRHAVVVLDGKVIWDPSPLAPSRTIPYDPVNVYYRLVIAK